MSDASNYLRNTCHREITHNYKEFLSILEDIQFRHDESFVKLLNGVPEEYKQQVIQAGFFDSNVYNYFRKKILDRSNDSIREIQRELDKYEVDFKK